MSVDTDEAASLKAWRVTNHGGSQTTFKLWWTRLIWTSLYMSGGEFGRPILAAPR